MSKGEMKKLRRDGFVPASISQKGTDALSFSVKRDELARAMASYGVSGVYRLQMGRKKAINAMLRELQSEPLTRAWLHVTFQQVSMSEETKAELPIHLHGRDTLQHQSFELVQSLDHLPVRGLPGSFPTAIEVDVSGMQPGDTLMVADLKLPEGLETDAEPDRLVLSVSHPRVQEEPAAQADTATQEAATQEAAAPDAE